MFQLCYRTFAFNDHPIIQDKNRSETTRPARDELRFQGEYTGVDSYLDVFPVLGAECVKKKKTIESIIIMSFHPSKFLLKRVHIERLFPRENNRSVVSRGETSR